MDSLNCWRPFFYDSGPLSCFHLRMWTRDNYSRDIWDNFNVPPRLWLKKKKKTCLTVCEIHCIQKKKSFCEGMATIYTPIKRTDCGMEEETSKRFEISSEHEDVSSGKENRRRERERAWAFARTDQNAVFPQTSVCFCCNKTECAQLPGMSLYTYPSTIRTS